MDVEAISCLTAFKRASSLSSHLSELIISPLRFKTRGRICLKRQKRPGYSLRIVDSVRTIIQRQNEYIYIPDLREYANA